MSYIFFLPMTLLPETMGLMLYLQLSVLFSLNENCYPYPTTDIQRLAVATSRCLTFCYSTWLGLHFKISQLTDIGTFAGRINEHEPYNTYTVYMDYSRMDCHELNVSYRFWFITS